MLYVHESTPDGFNARLVEKVICHDDTKYQTVTIVTHANLGRTLYLDGYFQSDDSFQAEYHNKMVELSGLTEEKKNILICGSGPGGLTAACRRKSPDSYIVGVELDPEAFTLYRQHLPDWGSDNELVIIANAFDYLGKCDSKLYDILFWDLDADALIGNSVGSFDNIKRILRPNGSFVATAGSIQERPKDSPYKLLVSDLKVAFPSGELFEYTRMNWNFFSAKND